MADQVQEFMDIPRDFIKDGTQFINKCTKRTLPLLPLMMRIANSSFLADRHEFIKISQAVGVGFLVMGAVVSQGPLRGESLAELHTCPSCDPSQLIPCNQGYIVKLIHIPVNNILVGGA